MPYKPTRDSRFEYVWDVISFIEENQCGDCLFRKVSADWGAHHAAEFPMCPEIESPLSLERVVDELDDRGLDGVVCLKFQDPATAQEMLFPHTSGT